MTDQDPIGQKTDEELAREARAGSSRSFEELALRYKRRLFVYFRPRLGSDQDAEDLVQETFLKLYRNIHHYDPAFRFSTWLYTSANRLAISSYRRKKATSGRLGPEVADDSADIVAQTAGETRSTGLWDAAGILVGNQYRVLWLRYGEDLTIEEIAASIGKSRLAVRLLLHRARTNLMKRVGPAPGRAEAKTKAVAVGETPLG
ncbi:MAG: sigma-70 family RNA polymerase sigma factor [Candidatus Aminicenantes bacterium]|nr:sigma-70 family RNA polymerase sigma factor [Candidatus Aminicenantes bacterium]